MGLIPRQESPLNVTDTAEIIAMTRDIVFLILALLTVLLLVMVFMKVSAILNSAKRTIKDAEDIVSTVSHKVVRPATIGSGAAFGLGKLAAFLAGFVGRRRGRKEETGDGE